MGSLLAQPGADSFYGEPSEGIFPHIPVEETNPRVRFQPPPTPPPPRCGANKGRWDAESRAAETHARCGRVAREAGGDKADGR